MAKSWFVFNSSFHSRGLFNNLIFFPTALALLNALFILVYVSKTSFVFFNRLHHNKPTSFVYKNSPPNLSSAVPVSAPNVSNSIHSPGQLFDGSPRSGDHDKRLSDQQSAIVQVKSNGHYMNSNEVFHDRDVFLEDYKQMNRSFRIYVYPHNRNDPFANLLLPVGYEPRGNYASESYFKKVLAKSHFITKDPSEADLFYMPFSIVNLRYDPRIGVEGIPDFIRNYVLNISHQYPYWNRTGGADHFYVACHSIGKSAMRKASQVKLNAIQVVCSSSYFLPAHFAHKDVSLPQIWPRHEQPSNLSSSKRKKLGFFAGAVNSPIRKKLVQVWRNDPEIYAHAGRLKTPYADKLLGSKFCLHVKGFEVNTARIADSVYYGCVPVILADHYDLPFADTLNWKSFGVVVDTIDIPLLKKILKGISSDQYLLLQSNVLRVRKHFLWHLSPVDYDAFHMVMYELWLRRSCIRVQFSA